MNNKLNKDRLIRLLVGELKTLLAVVGPCDHAKGVCYCAARKLVEMSETMLKAKRRII